MEIVRYIVQADNGKFVATDLSSGGYPYLTSEIDLAEMWDDKKPAENYLEMFPNIEGQHVSIKRTIITIED